ncbi:MAG: hypothetical protein K0R27_5007, partial [Xanthobacteraceae bacterium]|nr:hypothetical protein [Xanthobacteraceae bacterium]
MQRAGRQPDEVGSDRVSGEQALLERFGMDGAAPEHHRVDQRDADGAAEVAHQVEQAAGVRHRLGRQGAQRQAGRRQQA